MKVRQKRDFTVLTKPTKRVIILTGEKEGDVVALNRPR
jgi:hypothetical protein